MLVQLIVERDQNECVVNLAGTAYKFKRNEYGHLVSEITDQEHIKWVSDPHNNAFKLYVQIDGRGGFFHPVIDEPSPAMAPIPEPEREVEKKLPPYPQKGSKRPTKRES